MDYDELALALQLIAERQVGSVLRRQARSEEAGWQQTKDLLRSPPHGRSRR